MKQICIITCMCLSFISCTYKINSIKYNLKVPLKRGDIFYVMPKTILEIKIIYNVKQVTSFKDGAALEPGPPTYTVKGITFKPVQTNDSSKLFILRGKNISHKFFLKENINILFNDQSTITSVQTEFEDQSTEFTENIIKGASSIAKILLVAGSSGDPFITDLNAKIKTANSNLVKAIEADNAKDIAKYKKQLAEYYTLINDFISKNKEVTTETSIEFVTHITPDFEKGNEIKFASDLPVLKVTYNTYDSKYKTNLNQVVQSGGVKDGLNIIPGLVYPIPSAIETEAKSGNQTIFKDYITYSQNANYGIVPITSKLFSKRTTTLELHPTTGTLKSYKTEAGSSSEKLGKTFETTASQLQTTLNDIKFDLKIQNLEKEKKIKELEKAIKDAPMTKKDSLNSELEILKVELELEQIRKQIDDLKSEKK